MDNEATTRPPPRRFAHVAVIGVVIIVLLLLLALRMALQPRTAARFLLGRLGNSLGLQITAASADYRLRGTPQLVLQDVVARAPGQPPLLRARRVYVSLPWSTIRARGGDWTARRIELDSPRFDLPAYQRWAATRPPSARRLPTLTDGLQVRDGRIHNNDWDIDGIELELPVLHPERPLQARLRARYVTQSLRIPLDMALAMSRPVALIDESVSGFAARGRVTLISNDWKLPSTLALSGPLQLRNDSLRITPAHLGLAARYQSGKDDIPFSLGLHGPLRFGQATWVFAPGGVVLRGDGLIPTLDARGALALGRRLFVQLDGRIAQWPHAWPALPAPMGASRSPLQFALGYTGNSDLSGISTLRLQRDASDFNARFRLPDVLAWINAKPASPLPPLDGHLSTPRLDISGAQLEGVEIEMDGVDMDAVDMDDPALPPQSP